MSKIENKKSNWRVWLRDTVIVAVIISAVSLWQSRNMLSSDGSIHIPQQNLVSLTGKVEPMLAENKPNLLYFFAPWCKICSLSIGNLTYLNPDSVNVVVIALDYSSREEVEAFVIEHELNTRVFLGHEALKQQFKIQGYPSYYLVNEDQKISSSVYGYSTAIGLKLREAFGH
ncbi:redoxin domain-containing protein [Glaciecola petra]|uniref:Redoxin domain-containing protein n=1 Tax=Glaciecola petra TaxID=3075602 RepID=A0ABU2ZW39_9ALTE|nr:redoxin domain-containing protein [Aestuariibacter sp. P117]MDT0596630.1 redoxin domain-containing protein [Aestuariibacter sp. P117]